MDISPQEHLWGCFNTGTNESVDWLQLATYRSSSGQPDVLQTRLERIRAGVPCSYSTCRNGGQTMAMDRLQIQKMAYS